MECKENYTRLINGGHDYADKYLKRLFQFRFCGCVASTFRWKEDTQSLSKKNSVPCVVIFKQGHFYITLCYLKHRDLVLENSFLLAAKWSRMYREFSKVILWARVCKTSTRYRFWNQNTILATVNWSHLYIIINQSFASARIHWP